ncbi:hypothetical protein [uncultured Thiodictyon sp.]|uniref:nSTAND1 domain-containing NTPase n=1 Tax=uncultured Thiodictyon sp. TaxID=1846217 RepID=UPI0025E93F0B|nr:hypothetical protein [uncultured Thiodictyon sp.]
MTDWQRERQELHAYYDRMRGRALAVVGWYIVDYKQGFGEATVPVAPGAAPSPAIPNPYLGLDSFQEKDAERFFGREALLEKDLWPAFQVLMAGPSGTGDIGGGLRNYWPRHAGPANGRGSKTSHPGR